MEKEIVKEVQEAQKVPKQKLNTKKEYEKQKERSNKREKCQISYIS